MPNGSSEPVDHFHLPQPDESPMDFILQPWQLYLVILAGWINREQQEVIEYLRTENHVLKEKLGKKRILLNDDQLRHGGGYAASALRRLHAESGRTVDEADSTRADQLRGRIPERQALSFDGSRWHVLSCVQRDP